MNTPVQTPSNGAPPPNAGANIEPASHATPQTQADELLAHGLLTYLHNDHPAAQNARVTRVMSAIGADSASNAPEAPAPTTPYRFRMPIRTVRGWVALAASIGLVALAGFFGFPGETSAQAVVKQSIEAMRAGVGGGDRRYEVRLTVRKDGGDERTLDPAIVDMRSPNQLLLRVRSPEGDNIVAGRDEKGDWCIRLARDGGGIEREHPQMAWPRWSKVGDESLFADSVDRLLEEMTRGYTLSRQPDAALESAPGKAFRHILATKKRLRAPGGDTVEIWIDPATNAVERMVMKWNDPPAGRAGDAQPAQARPDDAARGDGPAPGAGQDDRQPLDRPMRPRGPRPGPDGEPNDGPNGGPDGDRPDRPLPPRRPRPFPRDGGPDNGPMGRPDRGPDAGPEGEPDGDRLPPGPRDRPHRGPEGDGPMGIPGLGPVPPGAFGPRQQGPQGAGPNRAPGDRHGPPKMIVIQRVDAPAFEAGWFSPEAHNK